ncbi:MAG: SRPBCC domain-containing protein [Actinomycetota bacterium]
MTDSTAAAPIVVSRRIEARRDVVFNYFTDPEKMLRWMGTEVTIDPTPGGALRLDMNGSDVAVGSYVEVDRPNRLVFTWGWEGSSTVPPASSTVTITLTADGSGTVLELQHDGLPPGQNTDHNSGWVHFVGRLVSVSEGRDPD